MVVTRVVLGLLTALCYFLALWFAVNMVWGNIVVAMLWLLNGTVFLVTALLIHAIRAGRPAGQ